MTFTFNNAIPAAPNNPSVDQPDMLTNNISTDSILAVDHISFNTANGGTHKYVNFSKTVISDNIPGLPSNPSSFAYTGAGVVDTTHPQLYFKNSNNTFLVNCIKAFGSFNNTPLGTTFINNMNCTLSINGTGTLATITLTAGATTSTSFIVIPFSNSGVTSTITGANTFVLGITPGLTITSFIVLQA